MRVGLGCFRGCLHFSSRFRRSRGLPFRRCSFPFSKHRRFFCRNDAVSFCGGFRGGGGLLKRLQGLPRTKVGLGKGRVQLGGLERGSQSLGSICLPPKLEKTRGHVALAFRAFAGREQQTFAVVRRTAGLAARTTSAGGRRRRGNGEARPVSCQRGLDVAFQKTGVPFLLECKRFCHNRGVCFLVSAEITFAAEHGHGTLGLASGEHGVHFGLVPGHAELAGPRLVRDPPPHPHGLPFDGLSSDGHER
mmetsp:Transcript_15071/g.30987  ORF Transcript_15071/g.30987 Transcript_15071/m.30987 type:complete len:248 (+) Transcript_15071:591-1334(+)